ncbi:gas vesicle protein [Streptomyces sp. NPDC096176]|uniref:gas vesicle protein n=1 Tax=Streptomyces sp. NPDC096176 TaxID=3366079 RepID=UPI00382333C4
MTTATGRFPGTYDSGGGADLADILERVLDKGIVIAGDIRINLLDIELLTIKLRLIVASVDKAKEMGIDWWEDDPALSSGARRRELEEKNAELERKVAELQSAVSVTGRGLAGENEPQHDHRDRA